MRGNKHLFGNQRTAVCEAQIQIERNPNNDPITDSMKARFCCLLCFFFLRKKKGLINLKKRERERETLRERERDHFGADSLGHPWLRMIDN